MKRRHAEPARLGSTTHDAEVRGGDVAAGYAGAMRSEMDGIEAEARAYLEDLLALNLFTVETPEPAAHIVGIVVLPVPRRTECHLRHEQELIRELSRILVRSTGDFSPLLRHPGDQPIKTQIIHRKLFRGS